MIKKIPFVFLFISTVTYAALGERSVFKQSLATEHPYTVHEITHHNLTLREYSANGVVFAITWVGIRHPDLTPILGNYVLEFQTRLAQTQHPKGARSYRKVIGKNFIVERGGHMRWLHGRAYIPNLIPEGVNLNEIK